MRVETRWLEPLGRARCAFRRRGVRLWCLGTHAHRALFCEIADGRYPGGSSAGGHTAHEGFVVGVIIEVRIHADRDASLTSKGVAQRADEFDANLGL